MKRRPRRRSLKSQIREDAKKVFLSVDDFAKIAHIRYWRYGRGKPPEDLRVPIVINNEGNMDNVWNQVKNIQRVGRDQILYQVEIVLFCAREDFDPPPKKGRTLQMEDDTIWEVLGVDIQGGILKVELRQLEE